MAQRCKNVKIKRNKNSPSKNTITKLKIFKKSKENGKEYILKRAIWR